jgi:hypothetical protein
MEHQLLRPMENAWYAESGVGDHSPNHVKHTGPLKSSLLIESLGTMNRSTPVQQITPQNEIAQALTRWACVVRSRTDDSRIWLSQFLVWSTAFFPAWKMPGTLNRISDAASAIRINMRRGRLSGALAPTDRTTGFTRAVGFGHRYVIGRRCDGGLSRANAPAKRTIIASKQWCYYQPGVRTVWVSEVGRNQSSASAPAKRRKYNDCGHYGLLHSEIRLKIPLQ